MNEANISPLNQRLAEACQAAGAACCHSGFLFLPDTEYLALAAWLEANHPGERAQFEARMMPLTHAGFHLYDQRHRCQFLDRARRCRLHKAGVKPTEYFWWPYHVYAADNGQLEIRVCTACCEAHRQSETATDFVDTIECQARAIGLDLMRDFRREYAGGYPTRLVRTIAP